MSDHILEFWNAQARKFKDSPLASWGDSCAVDLEIKNIGSYINEGDRVLDVGCANGHATYAQLGRGVSLIKGIDFSEAMITEANNSNKSSKLSFEVGDIRNLPFSDDLFDVVYTTRTLINLPTWETQITGICECIRVCKVGGTIVLSEGFWEPLVRLNAMRCLVKLPPLVEHDFNKYIKKNRLEEFLQQSTEAGEFENRDFSSIYYLGSRLLRELVTDHEEYEGYSNPINGEFYDLQKRYSGGGFGIQQSYAFKKVEA